MSSIAIIVPAYNAAGTIEKCLTSIFAQTYRGFEVIVVDDGSVDATPQKVLDFAQTIKNKYSSSKAQGSREAVRLVRQQNQGAPAARNRGAKEAKGEYLIFCDADIVLHPDCLEKMLRALEENPEATYAYSSFKFGWKTFKLWPFSAERLRKIPYIHATSLIRAEHFPGWDEEVKRLQDWDLWLTMLEHRHTGVWIPEVLFQVVNTKGTMSAWLPAFAYKIPKWLDLQPKAVTRYNEAVARIRKKYNLE